MARKIRTDRKAKSSGVDDKVYYEAIKEFAEATGIDGRFPSNYPPNSGDFTPKETKFIDFDTPPTIVKIIFTPDGAQINYRYERVVGLYPQDVADMGGGIKAVQTYGKVVGIDVCCEEDDNRYVVSVNGRIQPDIPSAMAYAIGTVDRMLIEYLNAAGIKQSTFTQSKLNPPGIKVLR
ncbi:hypothetical protein HYU13_02550 [Candidatus Woesearchaeota archaeon]|nr:hypothetical protein [Candidatus Woesearchaeota archaeon]